MLFERESWYKSTEKKICKKSDIFQQDTARTQESTAWWSASFRHLRNIRVFSSTKIAGHYLERTYLLRSHKDVTGTELHFRKVWWMSSPPQKGQNSHASLATALPPYHQESYKLYLVFISMPVVPYFQVMHIYALDISWSLTFCLYRTDTDPPMQFLTAAAHKCCMTCSCYPHLFHRLQSIPFCHAQWVSSPSLPSQHRLPSSINSYWSEIPAITSSIRLRNVLFVCFGHALWKTEDNLMNIRVNISFEYLKYVVLHNGQRKLKIQKLPLRNFCKSQ